MFRDPVTSMESLRAIIGGDPSEVARRKELPALDIHARAFIARSPFLLLGTSSVDGRCDVSPKGDAPGFVRVLDDQHLAIPIAQATSGSTACATSSPIPTSG